MSKTATFLFLKKRTHIADDVLVMDTVDSYREGSQRGEAAYFSESLGFRIRCG